MNQVAHLSRAGEYRKRADMLRLLARQTRCPDTSEKLLGLARSFDKLAGHVERRKPAPAYEAADRGSWPMIMLAVRIAERDETNGRRF